MMIAALLRLSLKNKVNKPGLYRSVIEQKVTDLWIHGRLGRQDFSVTKTQKISGNSKQTEKYKKAV